MRKGVDIERSVFPIINKCLDGIIRAADCIDSDQVNLTMMFVFRSSKNFYSLLKDSQLVIERYKSGFLPPEDLPFEDLSTIRSGSVGSDSSSNGGGGSSSTITSTVGISLGGVMKTEIRSGTLSAIKLKKRTGIFSLFNAGKVRCNCNY